MTRWFPVPASVGSSLAIAELSPAARCVWFGLRHAHAGHGKGGVIPESAASERGLPLVAPALVVDIDVAQALDELKAAGLIKTGRSGVELTDWDSEAEEAPCSRCRRKNPDPRNRRCPKCRERDSDPKRRVSQNAADPQQGSSGRIGAPQHNGRQGATRSADSLQTGCRSRAGDAQSARAPYQPTDRPDRPDPYQPTHATADRKVESTACAPSDGSNLTPTAVRQVVESWRLENRGVELLKSTAAIQAVADLLERLGWNNPDDLHEGPVARQRERREQLRRRTLSDANSIARWANRIDELALFIIGVAIGGHARQLCRYLRKCFSHGDPGTLLRSRIRQVSYSADVEAQLEGRLAHEVMPLFDGARGDDDDSRDQRRELLRVQLRTLLDGGSRVRARRVLDELLGSDRSESGLAHAVTGICTLAEAREVLAA